MPNTQYRKVQNQVQPTNDLLERQFQKIREDLGDNVSINKKIREESSRLYKKQWKTLRGI